MIIEDKHGIIADLDLNFMSEEHGSSLEKREKVNESMERINGILEKMAYSFLLGSADKTESETMSVNMEGLEVLFYKTTEIIEGNRMIITINIHIPSEQDEAILHNCGLSGPKSLDSLGYHSDYISEESGDVFMGWDRNISDTVEYHGK